MLKASDCAKKKFVVLVPHPPHLDPRITWVCNSLKKKGLTKVVYTYPEDVDLQTKSREFYTTNDTHYYPYEQNTSLFLFAYHYLQLSTSKCANYLFLIVAIPVIIAVDLLTGIFNVIVALANLPKAALNTIVDSFWITRFIYRKLLKKPLKSFIVFTSNLFPKTKRYYGYTKKEFLFTYLRYFRTTHYSLAKAIHNSSDLYDVIYCNELSTLLIGIDYKRKYPNCTLIYDSHEIYWDSINGSPWIFKLIFKYYEALLLKKIDAFINVSPQITAYYKSAYKLENKNLYTIPNACPLSSTETQDMESKEHNEKVRFLYQGAFAPGRGLEEFVQAWVNAKPLKATLTLRGPDCTQTKDKLIKIAGETINKTIFFDEMVSEDQLISASKAFDVGVIPYPPGESLNQKYCCPNKFAQYMQAELALIASNTEYITSLIKENDLGLVYNNKNIVDIVEKIQAITNNSAIRTAYQKNAVNFVKNIFNWENYETILFKIIDQKA